MHIDKKEMEQLDKGWILILIIWGAFLASLGLYFVVCIIGKDQLQVGTDPNFPIKSLKYALFGASFIILFLVHHLRKFLFRISSAPVNLIIGKYLVIVIITLALIESIGIYGLILFILAKDTLSLYLLLIISASAMIYFRPKKEELVSLISTYKLNWPILQITSYLERMTDFLRSNLLRSVF